MKMQIGAFDAKNRLGSLLDLVERGEEVTITRHGKVVARLVPASPVADRNAASRAADEIRALSKGVTLAGIGIKDLIEDGRR